MIPTQLVDLAKLMFETYSTAVGGKSVNGDDIPLWEDVPDKVREGWIAAAKVGYREGYADSDGDPMIPLHD